MDIASSAILTCLGDGAQTFARLLECKSGVGPLRRVDPQHVRVTRGYHVDDSSKQLLASRWLVTCVRSALTEASLDRGARVVVIVGTGLRELRAVETAALGGTIAGADALHFAGALREVTGSSTRVITISNACSAGGHALAIAEDLIAAGEADAVIAAGTDSITASMLAMIGRFTEKPTDCVRPFDVDRGGALLGEGAAAVLLMRAGTAPRPLGRLVATAMSCDAHHETQPSAEGIERTMRLALDRAGRPAEDVDLIVTHGTGTALNDPTEAVAIKRVFGFDARPTIAAVKGAVGHMSGAAALVNLDVALRAIATSRVPPVVGLRRPIDEAKGLNFVLETPRAQTVSLAQIHAFGFGGVNAIALVEHA